MAYQESFDVHTRGRGSIEITAEVARIVRAAGLSTGIAHVFVQHTSCSLVLTENADPSVRRDLETLAAAGHPTAIRLICTMTRAMTTWRRMHATSSPAAR
jgi:secondary thiamine-phosphate synthase enzyme